VSRLKGGFMQILKLKEFREDKSLTQRDMAKLLNVSQNCYFTWEKGVSFPNPINILKLCEIFKCRPDDLFGIKGTHAVTVADLRGYGIVDGVEKD
jgi:DNA-binding XRE family transcriptional regulator